MNNLLEKKTYYQMLFSFYGSLLTEKQIELFTAYYENDFSLQEIADEFSISRNAVHDALKNAIKNLEHFEESLGLFRKYTNFEKLYLEYQNDPKCIDLLNKIKETRTSFIISSMSFSLILPRPLRRRKAI